MVSKNTARLVRSRTTGAVMLGIFTFLIIAFLFGFNEPTQIGDIPICPPFCDEPFSDAVGFDTKVPTFDERTIAITPIITLTNDDGQDTTFSGKTTFFTPFAISTPEAVGTFDDGRLKIDLNFETDTQRDEEIIYTGTLTILNNGNMTDQLDVSDNGFTENAEFLTTIFNDKVNTFVTESGKNRISFVLDMILVFDEVTWDISDYQVYTATFNNQDQTTIEDQNTGEGEANEVPPEDDNPLQNCSDKRFDSISPLFPTTEVSGFSGASQVIQIENGMTTINVEMRNNRNCILEVYHELNIDDSGTIIHTDSFDMMYPAMTQLPVKIGSFDESTVQGNLYVWCVETLRSQTDREDVAGSFCGVKIFPDRN